MARPVDKWFSMRTDFFGADAYHLGLYDLSPRALALYVASIAYASRWGITYCHKGLARQIAARPGSAVRELVDEGFWIVADQKGCYHVAHEGVLWRRGTPLQRRSIPRRVRAAVYARDNHECVECGSPDELTLDHIWPYSKGGTDQPDNLRTLCRSCNSRKGARTDVA